MRRRARARRGPIVDFVKDDDKRPTGGTRSGGAGRVQGKGRGFRQGGFPPLAKGKAGGTARRWGLTHWPGRGTVPKPRHRWHQEGWVSGSWSMVPTGQGRGCHQRALAALLGRTNWRPIRLAACSDGFPDTHHPTITTTRIQYPHQAPARASSASSAGHARRLRQPQASSAASRPSSARSSKRISIVMRFSDTVLAFRM